MLVILNLQLRQLRLKGRSFTISLPGPAIPPPHVHRPPEHTGGMGDLLVVDAAAIFRRNVFIYGVGGIIAPFIFIKLIDLILTATGAF
jgi:hypothetical protein